MSDSSTRQRFTKQFKDDAVQLVVERGYSCEETGRRLGVSANNISRWVRQHRDKVNEPTHSGLSREQLEAELKRLRKENKRLEMEREILKKATAFFAKESN
jgi:transposase